MAPPLFTSIYYMIIRILQQLQRPLRLPQRQLPLRLIPQPQLQREPLADDRSILELLRLLQE